MDILDGQTACEWADSELERAARLLRASELSQAELEQAAGRVEALARHTGDEAARIEIEATAEVLLQLPACLRDEAILGPRHPRRVSAHRPSPASLRAFPSDRP